jgi:hypothetical protein
MSFTTVIPKPPAFENATLYGMYNEGFLNQFYGTILTLLDRSGNVVSQASVEIKGDPLSKRFRKPILDGIFERRYDGDFKYFYQDIPSWIADVMRRRGPRQMIMKVDITPWTPDCWLSETDWYAKGHDTLIIPTPKKTDERPKKRRA